MPFIRTYGRFDGQYQRCTRYDSENEGINTNHISIMTVIVFLWVWVWVCFVNLYLDASSLVQNGSNLSFSENRSFSTTSSVRTDIESQIAWNSSNTHSNSQYCCAMSSNGSISFAGVFSGTLYFSHDFGFNWTESRIDYHEVELPKWYTVAMSGDGQYGLVWCQYGLERAVYYRTEDFGRSYQIAFNGSEFYSNDVTDALVSVTGEIFYLSIISKLRVMQLVIIDNFGLGNLVYTTPPCRDSLRVHLDRGDRLFCTNTTFIQYSTDHGQTFQRILNIPELFWNAEVNFNQNMTKGLAWYNTGGGLNSGVYITLDGWNWTKSNFDTTGKNVDHVLSDFSTGRYVTLCAQFENIYTSSDYGLNFVMNTPPEDQPIPWYNLVMDSSGKHTIVTHHTTDVVAQPMNFTTGIYIGTRDITPTPIEIPSMMPTILVICNVGQYFDPKTQVCEDCPIGTYSTKRSVAIECTKCQYPLTTLSSAQNQCEAASLHVSLWLVLVIVVSLLITVVVCVAFSDQRVPLLLVLILPTLNFLSDIVYLLTNDFYHWSLLLACVLSLLHPIMCFFRKIVIIKAAPRLWWSFRDAWWLQAERQSDMIYFAKFPIFGRRGRFPLLSTRSHHSLKSLWLELIVWLVAIVAQLITIVMWMLASLLNIVLFLFWLLIGVFLHLGKVITIGNVWNLWFRVWTGGTLFSTDIDVDTETLNDCLREEFYFESMPQFVLQLANGLLLGRMTHIAWVSIGVSFICVLEGAWRFVVCHVSEVKPLAFRALPIGLLQPATKSIYRQISRNSATHSALLEGEEDEEEDSASLGERDDEHPQKEYSVCVVVNGLHERDALLEFDSDVFIRDANPVEATFVASCLLPAEESDKSTDDAESFNDWLVDQLIALRASPSEAEMRAKQMIEAGVRSQREWKEMSESDFNCEFLKQIGVSVTRMQYHLLSIHSTLRN